MAWCLEKLDRMGASSQKLKLPATNTLKGVAKAQGVVLNAIANRTLSTTEGQVLLAGLDKREQSIERQDLTPRLEEVERQIRLVNK